ncbi:uncharacterized protein EHS24_003137 [Apiotrichum porosum]|uniref:Uncharacterized protein n=1 Tax=Apiotrichum porosum TaxID=105984 RepID=A0A427XFN1_9TREE|nr:uncharacterized protein EHS24_003137 [Apiotrichum porosum]RSH77577.1 hypothetical protein EHS24_003137 [Apiotrichum porosum]
MAKHLVVSRAGGGISIAVVQGFSGLQPPLPLFCVPTVGHINPSTARLLAYAQVIDMVGRVDDAVVADLVAAATRLNILRVRANVLGTLVAAARTVVLWHDAYAEPSTTATTTTAAAAYSSTPITKEVVNVPVGSVMDALMVCSVRLRNTRAEEVVFHFRKWGSKLRHHDTKTLLRDGLAIKVAPHKGQYRRVTVVGLESDDKTSPYALEWEDEMDADKEERTGSDDLDQVVAAGRRRLRFMCCNQYRAQVGADQYCLETFSTTHPSTITLSRHDVEEPRVATDKP